MTINPCPKCGRAPITILRRPEIRNAAGLLQSAAIYETGCMYNRAIPTDFPEPGETPADALARWNATAEHGSFRAFGNSADESEAAWNAGAHVIDHDGAF